MVITYSKSKDQPGKVANPARGQLNICPRSRLRIWSRETGSAVSFRVSLLISILRLNLVLTYGIPPDFRGGVHVYIYSSTKNAFINPELGQEKHCKSFWGVPSCARHYIHLPPCRRSIRGKFSRYSPQKFCRQENIFLLNNLSWTFILRSLIFVAYSISYNHRSSQTCYIFAPFFPKSSNGPDLAD